MKDILKQIYNNTSGSAIIIGGVSKWLNGYTETYDKRWIDVVIPSSSVEQIIPIGMKLEIEGGTSFPLPTIDQFIIKTDSGYILDVFVNDGPFPSHIVSGSNVITPQGDVDFHMILSASFQTDYLHKKVIDIKKLYNL
jgi:hypothetical protein